jgi:hypothetical protein
MPATTSSPCRTVRRSAVRAGCWAEWLFRFSEEESDTFVH